MQVKNTVNFGHGSSVGRVRETNQDFHRVKTFQTPRGPLVFTAVADGMGGAAAGEHASKIAIDVVTDAVSRYVDLVSQGGTPISLDQAVRRTFVIANRQIHKAALENPSREGMGTTLTVLLFYGREAVLGHVGDSRAYLVRRGEVSQITRDHSWVADQVEKGILTREAAEGHQYRNLLMRALGTKPSVEPDVQVLELKPADTFILTSDGLHGLVRAAEFRTELERGLSLQSAVQYWIDLANERGGPDNITGVVVQVAQ